MALPGFFRTYKNKQFNYMPLYYNKQKDELQDRIKDIELEMGVHGESDFRSNIMRGTFKNRRSMRAKASRGSAIRVLIIVALLLALISYFLYM